MSKKEDDEKKSTTTILQSAPPPWHAVASWVLICSISIACLPSSELLDQVATPETFTNRVYPDYVSIETLVYTRLAIVIMMIAVTLYSIFFRSGWWKQATNYLPQTKLQQALIDMRGWRTQLPFTSWSWNLLTTSFALNAYIAYQEGILGEPVPQSLLRLAIMVFETAAPMALLVAFVVKYAIWPQVLANDPQGTVGLRHPRTLLWHNANVVVSLLEVSLLGGIPVTLQHMAVSPFIGLVYIVSAWTVTPHFLHPEKGPQFLYFFFDTTLGSTTTIALWALLVTLVVFYMIFSAAQTCLGYMEGTEDDGMTRNLCVHLLFCVVIALGVCRLTDKGFV